MGFLSGILSFIGDALSAVWHFIKRFWPLFIIAAIVFWPVIAPALATAWVDITAAAGSIWASIASFAATNGWLTTIGLGFGALSILDPAAASSAIQSLGSVAGAAAGAVGSALGTVAGSVANSIFSSPGLLIALGIGAFFLLGGGRASNQSTARKGHA